MIIETERLFLREMDANKLMNIKMTKIKLRRYLQFQEINGLI